MGTKASSGFVRLNKPSQCNKLISDTWEHSREVCSVLKARKVITVISGRLPAWQITRSGLFLS